MMDVVETLLAKGASVTAVDGRGLSPPLACAANEDVAMCLAMILSVFLATPANSEARRSICSLGMYLFDILPFKLVQSPFTLVKTFGQISTTIFDTVHSKLNRLIILGSLRLSESSFSSRLSEVSAGDATYTVDSPERSHPSSAVADPSTSNGAFQITTKSSTMTLPNTTTTTPGDVNHNISNGNGSASGEPDL